MEHHLNRRVAFDGNPVHKSLYKWSLQEFDENDAKVGRDMIPWEWGLDFTATNLSYLDGLNIEPDYSNDEPELATRLERQIRAKLRPGAPDDWRRNNDPIYSMFGTDRTINVFELIIRSLPDDTQQDKCTAWGSVSYTMEIDFRDVEAEDTIVFYLYVQSEIFERYVTAINAKQVDQAVLILHRVSGFYSDWSPSISTGFIKVLTNYEEDHPVEMPDDCKIVPPRLGEVGETSLTLVRKLTLEAPSAEISEEVEWNDVDEFTETPPDVAAIAAQHSASANVRAVALLSSLRTAAWVIAALLILRLIM